METTLPTYDDIVDWLINRITTYLNIDPEWIETDKALGDYGLDSFFAVNLCTELEYEFDILVPPSIAWDYPTIGDLAAHLAEELGVGR
jgi:acyl carrier protein